MLSLTVFLALKMEKANDLEALLTLIDYL